MTRIQTILMWIGSTILCAAAFIVLLAVVQNFSTFGWTKLIALSVLGLAFGAVGVGLLEKVTKGCYPFWIIAVPTGAELIFAIQGVLPFWRLLTMSFNNHQWKTTIFLIWIAFISGAIISGTVKAGEEEGFA